VSHPEIEQIRAATWSLFYDLRDENISDGDAYAAGELLALLGRLVELEVTQQQAFEEARQKRQAVERELEERG
jgi:hypothetical protein